MKLLEYKYNAKLSKMTKSELIAEYKKYLEKSSMMTKSELNAEYEKYLEKSTSPWSTGFTCVFSALVLFFLNSLRLMISKKNIICDYLSTPEKAEKVNALMSKYNYDTINELASAMLGRDSLGTMLYYDSGARDYLLSMHGTQSAIICGVIALAGTTYYLASKIKENIDKKNIPNYLHKIEKEISSREK